VTGQPEGRRAACRVCWRPSALTRRGLVWWHRAPVSLPDGRRPRCLGAGHPPFGQPGPEWDLLPAVLSARLRVLAPEHPGGTVYLLHFAEPFGHARHYIGWAGPGNLTARLSHHAAGTGANLLRHVGKAGISWELARTWPGGRAEERRMKVRGATRRCPLCRPGLAVRVAARLARPAG
jgi:hypothetical protein